MLGYIKHLGLFFRLLLNCSRGQTNRKGIFITTWTLSFFFLLSYGTIGVLRGHLGHFISSSPTSYHYFLTVIEMCFSLARFGPFSFRQLATSCLSIYVQVHNSQWAMFTSQALAFFLNIHQTTVVLRFE